MLPRLFIFTCLLCAYTAGFADDIKASYRLGSLDEFTVTVFKHSELSGTYTVPPDGIIDFPRAGHLQVVGKTPSEIAAALKKKYLEFLLDPQVIVVLTKARIKNAAILGAVAKPAQYQISETTRISDLIALSGDLVGEKKELTATLKRENEVIPVDLQSIIDGSKPEANLPIREGDELTILAPVTITVVVIGQVKNPGPLKLKEHSTSVDALAQAGDIIGRPERQQISLIRGAKTEKLTWGDTTTMLQNGDVIQVENEAVVRITVNGKVRNSGAYDLLEGGGVLEAIALAGGTIENAALSDITIIRANKPEKENVEHVDLSQAILKGQVTINPKLFPGDQVLVPEWDSFVSVFGSVNNAGKIPLTESTPLTVIDAISQAGVDNKTAKLNSVVVVRVVDKQTQRIPVNVQDILKKNKKELNITLMSGDIVYVPDRGQTPSQIIQTLYQLGTLAAIL